MPTVDLVYFNAGGGHRASALALQQSLAASGLAWAVRLVNLTEVLDAQGSFRKFTGLAPEDLYNKRLAHGLTLGLAQELKLLQALIRMAHQPMRQVLQQHWSRTEPDMVVSLIPNFNRALAESLAASRPDVPFVTVLTDLADLPPHFWIEPGLAQHVVCGSARAVQQARDAGHPAARIHPTSGMIIRPDFYGHDAAFDRAAARVAARLDPDRPTGVVMFGGHGSRSMLGLARRLVDTQLILLCGHNAKLARTLRALPTQAPRLVLEFTPKVADVLRLGDFFIGKPGPGALSEALQLGLPVVVTRNAWTMPQERYNTDWVREQGFGLVLPSFRNIRQALPLLLAQLPAYRARALAYRNRAVFELPGILASILNAARPKGDFKESSESVVALEWS